MRVVPACMLLRPTLVVTILAFGCDESAAPRREHSDDSLAADSGEFRDSGAELETPAAGDVDVRSNEADTDDASQEVAEDAAANDGSFALASDSSFASTDGGRRACTIFSPVVDAEVPLVLGEPLMTYCATPPADPRMATKGPMPPEAIRANGMGLNWELVRDVQALWAVRCSPSTISRIV
jgi:hypothetical protein